MLPNLEYGDMYFVLSWNLWSNAIWPNAESTSLILTLPINVDVYSDHLSTQWYFYYFYKAKMAKPDHSQLSATVQ